MAKKSAQKKKTTDAELDAEIRAAMNQPWMQMRTGLIVMAVASIVFAIFITWQLEPSEGLWGALGWGLILGAAMWVIFAVGLWFQRWIRRGQK